MESKILSVVRLKEEFLNGNKAVIEVANRQIM